MGNKKSDKKVQASEDDRMPLTKRNYIMLLIAFAMVVAGFLLMAGGKSQNPEEFNYAMFSFRRITLAPIIVLAGFAFGIYAIMAKGHRGK